MTNPLWMELKIIQIFPIVIFSKPAGLIPETKSYSEILLLTSLQPFVIMLNKGLDFGLVIVFSWSLSLYTGTGYCHEFDEEEV